MAVVIPCYREAGHVGQVVAGVPSWVRWIVVVDDACPENSGAVAAGTGDARVTVIRHEKNLGVGGAVVSGWRRALDLGAEIVVKLDGDGQMDPSRMAALVRPLLDKRADYVKGNRFRDFRALKTMPGIRLFANSLLSFVVKAASGYWNVMDPANGYVAVRRGCLAKLNLDRVARDHFFESDMLIRLNAIGAVVAEQPMPAQYGQERSTVRLGRAALVFPFRLARGFLRRVLLRYFIYDFNMVSVYLTLGLPLLAFGVLFGGYEWWLSWATGEARTIGTVMLAVLPIILGFQMLLQAIAIDIASVPTRPVSDD